MAIGGVAGKGLTHFNNDVPEVGRPSFFSPPSSSPALNTDRHPFTAVCLLPGNQREVWKSPVFELCYEPGTLNAGGQCSSRSTTVPLSVVVQGIIIWTLNGSKGKIIKGKYDDSL